MKKYLIAFAAVLLIACNRERQSNDSTSDRATPVDTLTFSYDSVNVYSKNIVKTDNRLDTTKATLVYPKFENADVNEFLKRQVFDYIAKEEKATSYPDIAESFVRGYDQYFKENAQDARTWWLEIKLSVIHQQAGYLAVRYQHADYTGGAHPNTYFSFINYDVDNKRLITLDSLVMPNKRKELTQLAEQIFRKQEKLGPSDSLAGKYFFENDKFALPENFYISKKGLVFFYNVYEIKPYVDGITEVTIPFDSLKDIAKQNTILTQRKINAGI